MDFNALFAPISAWFDAHPSATSWMLGWVSAICTGQMVKQMLPYSWDVTAAKRAVQAVATVVGSIVAYLTWPTASQHSGVYAFACGMSAPTAYTFLKALVETRWPNLAYRLSFSRVQDRKDPLKETVWACDKPDCPNKPQSIPSGEK